MKKILFSALLIAGAMSSCSKNEVTEVLPASDNSNGIGFNLVTSVSRAKDTNATEIRAAGAVTLYYYNTGDVDDIIEAAAGSIDYTYDSTEGVWSQSSSEVKWSDLFGSDLVGDATFFSLNKGEDSASDTPALVLTVEDATKATSGTYTPAATLGDQYDVVWYADAIQSVPVGGKITATFEHALSRIEMYADLNGTGYSAYVKSIDLLNIESSGVATITYEDEIGSIAWDTTDADLAEYSFLNFVEVGSSEVVGLLLSDGDLIAYDPNATTQKYTSLDSSDAIVIPQTIAQSDTDFYTYMKDGIESGNVPSGFQDLSDKTNFEAFVAGTPYYMDPDEIGGSVVYALYRMTSGTGSSLVDVVGHVNVYYSAEFTKMTDSDESVAQQVLPTSCFTYNDETGASTPTADYDDAPLYVLAAFPFSSDLELKPNYDYDFNLGFGTTGGLLVCDYYFFGDGTMTNIPIENLEPGDPLLPDSDTLIGLKVTDSDWTQAETTDLDGATADEE